ncbi:hypothetical protein MAA8898_03983 [Maliponia aquimaris]|uniref:Uncharacterized protein n=1 Tax=Maliponia aquimaris TaxID=1673631 RepID=A0A238L0T4_9RHOB|nr:hypothetical protein MAA8898_03983 [Maliponia aquimaris]
MGRSGRARQRCFPNSCFRIHLTVRGIAGRLPKDQAKSGPGQPHRGDTGRAGRPGRAAATRVHCRPCCRCWGGAAGGPGPLSRVRLPPWRCDDGVMSKAKAIDTFEEGPTLDRDRGLTQVHRGRGGRDPARYPPHLHLDRAGRSRVHGRGYGTGQDGGAAIAGQLGAPAGPVPDLPRARRRTLSGEPFLVGFSRGRAGPVARLPARQTPPAAPCPRPALGCCQRPARPGRPRAVPSGPAS